MCVCVCVRACVCVCVCACERVGVQGMETGQEFVEPLLATYQDAMVCVQGLSEWLANVYLQEQLDCQNKLSGCVSEQTLAERTAFGRVLSLLSSLATSHTVEFKPGVINVVYKSLIKVLEKAAHLTSPGFWSASFDGKSLADAMIHVVERSLGELFTLSRGANL